MRLLSSVGPTTNASTWPWLIASRSCSASWSCWRSDSISFSSCRESIAWFMASPLLLPELQADQRALGVGKVADDLAHRVGELAHQRRDGDDLVVFREARVLQEVDHLDLVAPGEVLFAHLLQVLDRGQRPRRLAGRVEAQLPRGMGSAILVRAHFRFLLGALGASAPRRDAAALLSSVNCCSRARSCSDTILDSSSTASNSLRSAVIWASSAARLRASSRRLRSTSLARTSFADFSRSSCAARIEPVSTPSGPT